MLKFALGVSFNGVAIPVKQFSQYASMHCQIQGGGNISESFDKCTKVEKLNTKKKISIYCKMKTSNILKQTMEKSKKNIRKLNKTIKKSSLKKCETFCQKDYIPEINKSFRKNAKKYNISYKSPTKQENDFAYNTCKKTFCNPKCDGYDFFGDEKKQKSFQKKIKNGFQNTFSLQKIKMLKKKGALSGCVDVVDYDVFHK